MLVYNSPLASHKERFEHFRSIALSLQSGAEELISGLSMQSVVSSRINFSKFNERLKQWSRLVSSGDKSPRSEHCLHRLSWSL